MGKTLRRPIIRFNRGRPRQHESQPAQQQPAPSQATQWHFDAEEVYDLAFRRASPSGSRFVEVTSGKGESACYMAARVRGGARVKASTIHTSSETVEAFRANIQQSGGAAPVDVQERVVGADCAQSFADGSLSFVFLDVSPTEAAREAEAWWPKLERGGLMAGAGYDASRISVDRFVAGAPSERVLRIHKGTWMVYRPMTVDAMYCINLPSRTDRRQAVEPQFRAAGLDVEFFGALDGRQLKHPHVISDGQAGCMASHLAAIAKARASGAKNALIFEDDVQLVEDFAAKFRGALSQCPSTYDILYVGAICVAKWGNYLHGFDNLLARAGRVSGAHAYVVNTDIEPRLQADLSPMRTWYDEYLMKKLQPEQRCYVCVPYLAAQVSGKSDVSGTWARTEDFSQYVWR